MARAPDTPVLVEPSLRQQLVELMNAGRHEEALALLYRARAAEPERTEIQQGIHHLKALLVRSYAARLGGLDRVVPPLPEGPRTAELLMLSRYIDGASTFGDIAEAYPLGRVQTLQLMVKLYASEDSATGLDVPLSSILPGSSPASREYAVSSSFRSRALSEEPAPETSRSPSSAPARGLGTTTFSEPESEDARRYKEAFARGTTAFVQERFEEAVEAFGACVELRENDRAASIMLRRSLQGLKSQVV